jgi:hypothetical protein
MRSVVVITLLVIAACSDSSSTSTSPSSSTSSSGGGGGADCASIEAQYKALATGATALDCAGDGDCDGNYGLCKPDKTVVRGNDVGVYNKTTTQKMIPLVNDWLIGGCAGANECGGSAGGAIACVSGKCGVK